MYCIHKWPLNIKAKRQPNWWIIKLLGQTSGFENRSIGFQRQACFELRAFASNPNVARQFHSPFGAELESKTVTCVQLNAWRYAELGVK